MDIHAGAPETNWPPALFLRGLAGAVLLHLVRALLEPLHGRQQGAH
jgi:hypothetical protein